VEETNFWGPPLSKGGAPWENEKRKVARVVWGTARGIEKGRRDGWISIISSPFPTLRLVRHGVPRGRKFWNSGEKPSELKTEGY